MSGVASLATASLTLGTHSITAAYSGDAAYLPSTSAAITQTVLDPRPAAPSNLVATANSSTQITLTWTDNATNETGFTLQRATNAAFTTGLNNIALAANTTIYVNTGRAPSTTYYYRILASNAVGPSAWSNVAFAFTAVTGSPAAPSNLAAVGFSPTQINLTWTDNATNETGFTIQRSTSPDFTGTTTITLNAVDQVAYSNTGRTPATTYYYRVRAFNAVGPSAWSNTASATTPALAPPAAPSNLVATAFSPNQVDLTWTDNANNETGFTIQRSANASFTGTTTITLNAIDQIALQQHRPRAEHHLLLPDPGVQRGWLLGLGGRRPGHHAAVDSSSADRPDGHPRGRRQPRYRLDVHVERRARADHVPGPEKQHRHRWVDHRCHRHHGNHVHEHGVARRRHALLPRAGGQLLRQQRLDHGGLGLGAVSM